MLRQYRPRIASLLPGPDSYPTSTEDVELRLDPLSISTIIAALNELGDDWLEESKSEPNDTNRNKLRQNCINFILQEWISVGEQCQREQRAATH